MKIVNGLDLSLIVSCLLFILLDMALNLTKLKGIFTVLRLTLIFRKLMQTVQPQHSEAIPEVILEDDDMRPPLEIILEILAEIQQRLNPSERRLIANVQYCIRKVQSNKLYEAELPPDN